MRNDIQIWTKKGQFRQSYLVINGQWHRTAKLFEAEDVLNASLEPMAAPQGIWLKYYEISTGPLIDAEIQRISRMSLC